jgi:hypothetical protein
VFDILRSDQTDSDLETGIPDRVWNIVKCGPDRVEVFFKKNGLGLII